MVRDLVKNNNCVLWHIAWKEIPLVIFAIRNELQGTCSGIQSYTRGEISKSMGVLNLQEQYKKGFITNTLYGNERSWKEIKEPIIIITIWKLQLRCFGGAAVTELCYFVIVMKRRTTGAGAARARRGRDDRDRRWFNNCRNESAADDYDSRIPFSSGEKKGPSNKKPLKIKP